MVVFRWRAVAAAAVVAAAVLVLAGCGKGRTSADAPKAAGVHAGDGTGQMQFFRDCDEVTQQSESKAASYLSSGSVALPPAPPSTSRQHLVCRFQKANARKLRSGLHGTGWSRG